MPAAAQQPAPPLDLTLHEPSYVDPVPPPLAPQSAACQGTLCRAQLIGELWKKGGVEVQVTPINW